MGTIGVPLEVCKSVAGIERARLTFSATCISSQEKQMVEIDGWMEG